MAQIPEQPVITPDVAFVELQLWWQTQEELTKLRNKEAAMRKRLAAFYFPKPNEGVNRLDLGNDFDLVLDHKINRSVDQPALESVKGADAKRLGLDLDALFQWKPSLVLGEYRELSTEQAKFVDALLDIKEGMPSMHIKPRGGASSVQPDQLTGPEAPARKKSRARKTTATKRAPARKR